VVGLVRRGDKHEQLLVDFLSMVLQNEAMNTARMCSIEDFLRKNSIMCAVVFAPVPYNNVPSLDLIPCVPRLMRMEVTADFSAEVLPPRLTKLDEQVCMLIEVFTKALCVFRGTFEPLEGVIFDFPGVLDFLPNIVSPRFNAADLVPLLLVCHDSLPPGGNHTSPVHSAISHPRIPTTIQA